MYPLCGKLHADKKAFLCILFVVQVCLIGGVLLFSTFTSSNDTAANGSQSTGSSAANAFDARHDNPVPVVEFVHRNATRTSSDDSRHLNDDVRLVTSGRYDHEFVGRQHCFRDGLARRPLANDSAHRYRTTCVCKLDYHGSDCGQPEVLWRAFMTARMPLKLAAISRRQPHSIYYLIHPGAAVAGSIAQLETLEIQIMELAHVVDMFVLCGVQLELRRSIRGGPLKAFAHKILVLAGGTADSTRNGCSLRSMYTQFRQHFGNSSRGGAAASVPVRTDDVLLASGPDEILNWRAVKYFKWYDHWPQPAQFRLKYLVYGYYWQHPQSTWLAAGAAQLSVLEEVHRGDPHRLLAATKPGMIVGDLNHVGGWYCQYCYHPLNVVRRLQAERLAAAAANRSGPAAAAVADAAEPELGGGYVEKLIANGLFVDGKLGLTRLHRFADKYYAPECVRNASWRYEGVLSNVYATYDDDYAK